MPKLPMFLLATLLSFSCSREGETRGPAPQSAPATTMKTEYPRFNGANAFAFLTAQTDFGPRNPNSAGHRRCLEYLTAELRASADSVALQSFTARGYGETLKLTNVFASFRPAEKRRILLLAHWDTRPRAEMDADPAKRSQPIIGANDGASGVAVLLELARMFKASPPPIGVDILLTDGEDYGDSEKDRNNDLYFLGARHFAKTKNPSYTPEYGILLDMVGDRDLQLPMEQHSMRYAPAVMEMVYSSAEQVGAVSFLRVPGELVADDHLPLNEAGIPTIDIIDFQYPHWHTHQDTPDKCAPESLEEVGNVLSYVIYARKGR
ncbi:MAG: M28 family peptidase [Bacteroidetes bacterium]|nr:MAG: M28 family peptidase [Bacteroidota bacterium]